MYNIIEFPNYFSIRWKDRDVMTFYRSHYDRIAVEWIMENLNKAYDLGFDVGLDCVRVSEQAEAFPDR